jgi:hypothetical protein
LTLLLAAVGSLALGTKALAQTDPLLCDDQKGV